MQKQGIVWCWPVRFDVDDSAAKGNINRLFGLNESRRVPIVLIDGPETEANSVEIQVLRCRMMVMLGSR